MTTRNHRASVAPAFVVGVGILAAAFSTQLLVLAGSAIVAIGICLLATHSLGDSTRSTVRCLIALSALARTLVGVVQATSGVFTPNADALVYAGAGEVVNELGMELAATLGYLPRSQRGIVIVNALSASLDGPIPLHLFVSLVAAASTTIAVSLLVYCANKRLDSRSAPVPTTSTNRTLVVCTVLAGFAPGILFWSAQNLKEPFLILSATVVMAGLYRRSVSGFIAAVAGSLGVFAFRPYIGVLSVAALAIAVVSRMEGGSRARMRRFFVFAGIAALVGGAVVLGPRFTNVELSQQRAYSAAAGGATSVEGGASPPISVSISQILFGVPVWRIPTEPLQAINFMEGVFIGLLMLLVLRTVLRSGRAFIGDAASVYAFAMFSAGSIIYGLGLANTGTLVRERSPLLFLMLPLLAHVIVERVRPARRLATAVPVA